MQRLCFIRGRCGGEGKDGETGGLRETLSEWRRMRGRKKDAWRTPAMTNPFPCGGRGVAVRRQSFLVGAFPGSPDGQSFSAEARVGSLNNESFLRGGRLGVVGGQSFPAVTRLGSAAGQSFSRVASLRDAETQSFPGVAPVPGAETQSFLRVTRLQCLRNDSFWTSAPLSPARTQSFLRVPTLRGEKTQSLLRVRSLRGAENDCVLTLPSLPGAGNDCGLASGSRWSLQNDSIPAFPSLVPVKNDCPAGFRSGLPGGMDCLFTAPNLAAPGRLGGAGRRSLNMAGRDWGHRGRSLPTLGQASVIAFLSGGNVERAGISPASAFPRLSRRLSKAAGGCRSPKAPAGRVPRPTGSAAAFPIPQSAIPNPQSDG